MTLNWASNDYFSMLMHRDKRSHSALEMLVDDIHAEKERTINRFLCHSGSEDFLWGLVKLLGSDNSRVAGNSAYIIGTIAESEVGSLRVISLTNSRHPDARKILKDLTNMLSFDDSESVMNAAGTMGTLAESHEGRLWMLSESCFDQTMINITNLLTSENQWTASNAALVLARITIAEEGCCKLLAHEFSTDILSRLVASLGVDEAGKGMNAAFAIGRICDVEEGRKRLLTLPGSEKMISSLAKMLCCTDPGSSKNACFALSCLATSNDGHMRLLNNSHLEEVLRTLSELLSADDPETGWFAAMTLHTLASQPKGCLKLRDHSTVIPALMSVGGKSDVGDDMLEEIQATLAILKRLSRPSQPVAEVKGPHQVEVTWSEVTTQSGFDVRYQLFDGVKCLYNGKELQCLVKGLNPHSKYTFRVRAVTEGDESQFSEVAIATTEESVPGPPTNVRILGATSTQLKIGWEPPEFPNGVLKGYNVYLGRNSVEHTHELSCILTGLHTSTSYEVSVCASTSKGKGPKASVSGDTADTGAHCPSKPQLSIMGRNEIHLSWHPPEVPIGRITRYDVIMNGKVTYSGTDLHFTARRLTPSTEYTFVVCALTNEGRFESKEAKKKTPKNEYDPDRAPLYQVPVRRESMEDGNKPPRRKKSVSGATTIGYDEVRPIVNNRLTSASSSRVQGMRNAEGEPNQRRPISATSSVHAPKGNSGKRTTEGADHKERLSSSKSSKSSNGSIKTVEDTGKSTMITSPGKVKSGPTEWESHVEKVKKLDSKKSITVQIKNQEMNDSGSDSSHEKKSRKKGKEKLGRTSSDGSEKSVKVSHKLKLHNSPDLAHAQTAPPERAKSDTLHRRFDIMSQNNLLPNSASKIESRGQRSDHDRHGPVLNRPINLTGVKSTIDNETPLRALDRESTVPEPDPGWVEMAKRYAEMDINRHKVNLRYEAPKSPPREEIHSDLDPPAVGKPLPIPQNFTQRTNTFIGSHRPSRKIPKQLISHQPSVSHSSHVKLEVDLPFAQATKNNSKFIPMGIRSPQLKNPGACLQRGNTSLGMTGKALSSQHNTQPLGLRLDGISRTHTQFGNMKPSMDDHTDNGGFALTSTKIGSGKLVKGNSSQLRPVDHLHSGGPLTTKHW